jgi:hypothetical protein
MKILDSNITIRELKLLSSKMFGNLVKAVVDVRKKIIVIDADLHADQEAYLLNRGSSQKDLWGINIYPDNPIETRIEFDSMINLRPNEGNSTRGINSKEIQEKILKIVNSKIKE